jgi:hypothetical protein
MWEENKNVAQILKPKLWNCHNNCIRLNEIILLKYYVPKLNNNLLGFEWLIPYFNGVNEKFKR